MTTKTSKTSEKGVIDLSKATTEADVPARTVTGWPGFGDLLESFPSVFNHTWGLPTMFNQLWPSAIAGFEPMKVEELVDGSTYIIRAEIPGVDPDTGIDINVENGRLTIEAEREERIEAGEANEFRSEFHYGSYRRSMVLPAEADADNVTATYNDGILEVSIPLNAEAPGAKKISITREG